MLWPPCQWQVANSLLEIFSLARFMAPRFLFNISKTYNMAGLTIFFFSINVLLSRLPLFCSSSFYRGTLKNLNPLSFIWYIGDSNCHFHHYFWTDQSDFVNLHYFTGHFLSHHRSFLSHPPMEHILYIICYSLKYLVKIQFPPPYSLLITQQNVLSALKWEKFWNCWIIPDIFQEFISMIRRYEFSRKPLYWLASNLRNEFRKT